LEKLKHGGSAANGSAPPPPQKSDEADFFSALDADARKALTREQLLESFRQHQKVTRAGVCYAIAQAHKNLQKL
jgi:hypothetical protein